MSQQHECERLVSRLNTRTDLCWLTGMTIGMGLTLVAARWFPYPQTRTGIFWAYAGVLLRVALYAAFADRFRHEGGELFQRLLALGWVAGALEILVDYALIHWLPTGQLVYTSGNDVVLLGSPVYMPLAWACVIVEFGYLVCRLYGLLARRIARRAAAVVASLVGGAVAGASIGGYEFFAYAAGWWRYQPARWMLGRCCALYIPLGEAFMFAAFLPLARRYLASPHGRIHAAIVYGAWFAAVIGISYLAAYALLELT